MMRSAAVAAFLRRQTFLLPNVVQRGFSSIINMSSLRNMMKPFYLKCHPDVQSSNGARETNQEAVQNLNSYLDLVDTAVNNNGSAVVQWPTSKEFVVEFVLSSSDDQEVSAKRRVELELPSSNLQKSLQLNHGDSRARLELHQMVVGELKKILIVAGLPVPHDMSTSAIDQAWRDEMDFDGSADMSTPDRFSNATRHPRNNSYEASREKFVQSMDHRKLQQIYKEAYQQAQIDLMTAGFIKDSPQRRHEFVNHVLSKTCISEEEMDPLDQLVTIRRLGLILEQHFEELHMEEFGKLWERVILVLEEPRGRRHEDSSGFEFTFTRANQLAIHVPINFETHELLDQLQVHLRDFHNLVIMDDLRQLYPSWADEL